MSSTKSSIKTEDIICYYNNDHTIQECSEYFGLSTNSIRCRFRKVGIADCRRGEKKVKNIDEIINYYNNGYSLKEISKKFNISSQKIQKELCSISIFRSREQVLDLIRGKSLELWKNDDFRDKVISNNKWDDERREKSGKNSKEKWEDEDYKNNIIIKMKKKWDDDNFRSLMLNKFNNEENRKKISINSRNSMSDELLREKISDRMKKQWKDKNYQEKMAVVRSNCSTVSSIQKILYGILDDLSIEYIPECSIGPYSFDCIIPLKDKKLLIECQGDYWHSLDKSISNDKAKSTYIERYYPGYEIKYLWEHEFSELGRVIELVKYWVGMTKLETIKFDFKDVIIKECPAKDYKLLLSKYHYLPNAGRGGMAHGSFGAYIGNELIAVCVFSPLVRQNLPFDYKTTRELSRLCIYPKYQQKNFASWFVSKCIKKLDKKYDTVISYCDTTFNHDGTIYRASNFKLDGAVRPDYWYVSDNGWVRHKKTLYEHAKKMGMKEREYSEKYNYKKVFGKEKLRFIFKRIKDIQKEIL